MSMRLFWEFVRFGLGGVLVFSAKIGFTYVFTELLELFYVLSYALVLLLTVIGSYFYNARVTYRSSKVNKKSFFAYTSTLAVFYVIDFASVVALTELLQLHYLLSIVFVTACLFVAKFFVFRKLFNNQLLGT